MITFQTSDHIVIYAQLLRDDNDISDTLLQIWHITDSTYLFSLDIKIPTNSHLFLVPNGLTVVICSDNTILSYS